MLLVNELKNMGYQATMLKSGNILVSLKSRKLHSMDVRWQLENAGYSIAREDVKSNGKDVLIITKDFKEMIG